MLSYSQTSAVFRDQDLILEEAGAAVKAVLGVAPRVPAT